MIGGAPTQRLGPLGPEAMEGPSMNEFEVGMKDTPARTASEQNLESLRESGGVFVEAVRVTRMPMMVTDATLPGNPITFANPAFVELSGYTLDELLGQQPHFMNGPQTDPDAITAYETAMNQGRDVSLEILQFRKDGSPLRAMLFATPLHDGDKVTNHSCPTWTSLAATRPRRHCEL